MITLVGYLFSCSLTYSSLSASNIGGKTDKDKGDHDTRIHLFSCSLTYSSLSASNIGGKTYKDKGDHDTRIPVLLFSNL